MPDLLVSAHMTAQQRLRELAIRAVNRAWASLPGYDERDVDQFVATAAPAVVAAQRQSVSLAEAFLGRALRRGPLGVDPDQVLAEARPGVTPEQLYRRPFVTVWAALGNNLTREAAIAAGLARATATAATDVQLAMRGTLRAVGDADDRIDGYRRVANPGACELCLAADGHPFASGALMPIHGGCGCGVEVITGERPDTPTTFASEDVTAAVREHGELGPVLVNAAHHFDAP